MKSLGKNAFTLTEALVAVALFAFLMTGLYTTLYAGRLSFEIQNSSLVAQRYARNALDAMSRELRMVDNIAVAQSSSSVTVTCDNPLDGAVTYSWTNDPSSSSANRIIRTTAAATRIIAQNISLLSVTNNADNVVIDLTATGTDNTIGSPESIQLIKKIAKR